MLGYFLQYCYAETLNYERQEGINLIEGYTLFSPKILIHELADSLRLLGDGIGKLVQLDCVEGHEGRCGRSAGNHELAHLILSPIA